MVRRLPSSQHPMQVSHSSSRVCFVSEMLVSDATQQFAAYVATGQGKRLWTASKVCIEIDYGPITRALNVATGVSSHRMFPRVSIGHCELL